MQLGGFAFIGEGIPIGLGAAFQIKYRKVSSLAENFSATVNAHCCLIMLKDTSIVLHDETTLCITMALAECRCCSGMLQEVLGEEDANQVAVNFFGDGTCNVGE